jgi:hypothetical protein
MLDGFGKLTGDAIPISRDGPSCTPTWRLRSATSVTIFEEACGLASIERAFRGQNNRRAGRSDNCGSSCAKTQKQHLPNC